MYTVRRILPFLWMEEEADSSLFIQKLAMPYLEKKLNIKSSRELKDILLDKCERLDLKELSGELRNFVYNREEAEKIELFPDYIRNKL